MTSAERECNSLFFERYNLQHKFQMHFFILIQGITKSPGMYNACTIQQCFKKKYVLRYQPNKSQVMSSPIFTVCKHQFKEF